MAGIAQSPIPTCRPFPSWQGGILTEITTQAGFDEANFEDQ